MSFDEDEKNFKGRDPGERDSYNMDNGGKKPRNSGDDFFKDEDFELEGYKDEEVESEGFRSKRIKEKRKKGKKFFRIIAVMLALVVVATGVVFGYRYIKNRFFSEAEIPEEEGIIIPESGSLELGQDINLAIACAGENLDEPEVSSIIFSSYSRSEEKLISLCIPVNTLMDIPAGIGEELVGESVKGGMDLLSRTLENNLGMEVDNYILLNVFDVVNKLGGIDLVLPEEIPAVKNYDDDSTFKLDKGKNLIDGAKAVNFLKYFSGMEKDVPIGDIIKQKLLLDAIISKIAGENDEEMLANLNLIKDFMGTDLSMEDQSKIFSTFSKIETGKNEFHALPISTSTVLPEGGIVWIPDDVSKIAEIFSKEGTVPEEEITSFTDTVRIKIYNGAYDSPGAGGLAANTSEIFEGLKFEDGRDKYEIVDKTNAPDKGNYENTQILVYSPDENALAAADDIKAILGVGSISVGEDELIDLDIIVILGKDYLEISAGSPEVETEDQLIKINILNGEGTAKLAFTVKETIESHFNEDGKVLEVVETKDADNWNYTQTEIRIFTSGERVETLAKQLQDWLGVGVIVPPSDNNVDNVDISIILGKDYTK